MKRFLTLLTATALVVTTTTAQDDCASAVVIGPGPVVSVAGTTVGFADDYNEDVEYVGTGSGPDVVYSYSPSTSDFYDLSLCQGTTNYDTKMYIYEGVCPLSGTGVTGTFLAGDDDECDNAPTYIDPWISSLTNVVMNAGTTYFIVIDGYSALDAGLFTLLLTPAAAPPTGNDLVMGEGRVYDYSEIPDYNLVASTAASVVANDGSTAVDATVTLNVFSDADGFVSSIFTDASAPTTVAPAGVELVVGSAAFTPPDTGVYIFEFVVTSSGTDDDGSNDTSFAFLNVTETNQSRDYSMFGAGLSATRLAVLDPSAEYGVVQSYATDVDVTGAILLVSVDPVFLGEPITANLYEVLGGDINTLSLVTSGSVPADTGTITFEIPLTASLTAGDYILTYAGQSFPVQTAAIYTSGSSNILRAVVTTGLWGAFAGPYAWSQTLLTDEAVAGCNSNIVPSNQSHTTLSNRFELNWDPQPGAVACQVNGQGLPGPSPTVNILGGDISTTNVPFAAAGAGNTYTWRVRCACSVSPLDVSAYSAYGDTFTVPLARQGDIVAVDLSMFPNPADNQLVVGMESAAGNANVTVIDMLGRVAIARTENMVEGYNNFTLDVSGLEPGAYFLHIEEGENTRVEEFSVAR